MGYARGPHVSIRMLHTDSSSAAENASAPVHRLGCTANCKCISFVISFLTRNFANCISRLRLPTKPASSNARHQNSNNNGGSPNIGKLSCLLCGSSVHGCDGVACKKFITVCSDTGRIATYLTMPDTDKASHAMGFRNASCNTPGTRVAPNFSSSP